jgi:Tfp pilus assembly protein PilO
MLQFPFLRSSVNLRATRTLLPLVSLVVVALGVDVAMLVGIVQPLQERLETQRATYETARQTYMRIKNARRIYEDLQAVWRQLPARGEFASLIMTVSETAQQDRVLIPGMTYSFQKVEGGPALQASVTFRAAGPYDAIRRFIYRLETSKLYLVIESLDATRSNKANMVEFNVRMVTFLKPDSGAKGGGI